MNWCEPKSYSLYLLLQTGLLKSVKLWWWGGGISRQTWTYHYYLFHARGIKEAFILAPDLRMKSCHRVPPCVGLRLWEEWNSDDGTHTLETGAATHQLWNEYLSSRVYSPDEIFLFISRCLWYRDRRWYTFCWLFWQLWNVLNGTSVAVLIGELAIGLGNHRRVKWSCQLKWFLVHQVFSDFPGSPFPGRKKLTKKEK